MGRAAREHTSGRSLRSLLLPKRNPPVPNPTPPLPTSPSAPDSLHHALSPPGATPRPASVPASPPPGARPRPPRGFLARARQNTEMDPSLRSDDAQAPAPPAGMRLLRRGKTAFWPHGLRARQPPPRPSGVAPSVPRADASDAASDAASYGDVLCAALGAPTASYGEWSDVGAARPDAAASDGALGARRARQPLDLTFEPNRRQVHYEDEQPLDEIYERNFQDAQEGPSAYELAAQPHRQPLLEPVPEALSESGSDPVPVPAHDLDVDITVDLAPEVEPLPELSLYNGNERDYGDGLNNDHDNHNNHDVHDNHDNHDSYDNHENHDNRDDEHDYDNPDNNNHNDQPEQKSGQEPDSTPVPTESTQVAKRDSQKENDTDSQNPSSPADRSAQPQAPVPRPKPDTDDTPYAARVARVSKTGFVERSVAAAVISAARQRGQSRKPRQELPAHHRLHGGYTNPWASALKENSLRTRGGSGSRTFFHKVAKDRRPPDELLATMLLLADRPDFDAGDEALRKDKYALASHWIGHCTFFLQTRGLTVLTDPVWSARLGPLGPRRLIPPPCEIDDLPENVDVVILSSACYDHYDKTAAAALSGRVGTWLVPMGVKPLLLGVGIPDRAVVELDWWQEHTIGGSKFVCTPAQHYSIRDDALWCSWVIHAPHHRIFFCGATGYRSVNREIEDSDLYEQRHNFGGPCCPVFKEIYRRYGSCDTAFLPIGGFKPRVLMSGVQGDAIDMLFIHRDLHARRSVGHRWGTFACADEGMLDAVRVLEKGLVHSPVPEHEFSYLKHGRVHVT